MINFEKFYEHFILSEDILTKGKKLKFDYSKKDHKNVDTSLGKSTKNLKFEPRVTTLPLSKIKVYSAYSKNTGDEITNILKSIKKSKDSKYKIDDKDYKAFIKRTSIFFFKFLRKFNIDTIMMMESSSNLAKDIVDDIKTKFPNVNIKIFENHIKKNINNLTLDFEGFAVSEQEKKSLTYKYNKIKNTGEFSIKQIRPKDRRFFKNWIAINSDAIKSVYNKHVIVFDDYITSGATLDEVGLSLNSLSPASVKMITILK